MSDEQTTGVPPSRTLLLWLAALAVTWVSGIEPTWRKVGDVAARFEEVNLQRHEADRKAIVRQQAFEAELAQQFNPDQQEARRAAARTELEANETRRQADLAQTKAHAEAVRATSNVDFELLGVKFTAEPLLASLLWSGFAFAWLVAMRHEAIQAEAIQAEAQPPDAQAGKPRQQAGDPRLLVLLTLLAWGMQVRVAWLGLWFTALTGETSWKALVAIAVCVLFIASAALVATVLAHRTFFAPGAQRTQSPRLMICTAVLVVTAIFAAVWWMPADALRLSHTVKPALPIMGLLPFLMLGFGGWYARFHQVAAHSSAGRRRFLIGSAGAGALAMAGVVWWERLRRTPPPSNYKAALRHPRRRHAVQPPIKLGPGFYLNTNKHKKPSDPSIVHYISSRGKVAARTRLPRTMDPIPRPMYAWLGVSKQHDVQGETDQDDSDVDDEKSAAPRKAQGPWDLETSRVALATSSWSFEHAALLLLSQHAAGRKNVKRACELLLNGIFHDTYYKKRHGNARKRSAPSYRLYDLAAGLAVRYNQPQVLEELKQQIQQNGYGLVFVSRIKKWENVNSAWYRRWRERQQPMRWHFDQQVSVF